MPERAKVESLIEACVVAGCAAQRAHDMATEVRRELIVRGTPPTPGEMASTSDLEAKADALSRAYLRAQQQLHEAGPSQFHQRMKEIAHRVKHDVGRQPQPP